MVIARAAVRASTGPLQVKPLKHPARHVPRTRTRLLRALLRPPALAMQGTVATPAQGLAQRAQQATSKLQQPMVIARAVVQASMGPLQDKPRKHPARPAGRASTVWEQEDPLKHHARTVLRTRIRLLRAVRKPPALAMQATVATPAQKDV